jgi:phosphoglycolate phosphatase
MGDPRDQAFLKEALEFFLAYYRVHKLDNTHLYAGVKEMLVAVQQGDGVARKLAVLSNKPVNPSRAIVEALGIAGFFLSIYGGNSFPTKKPDPEGVQTILREAGARAEETLIIGDSEIDVLTGRNAGLWTCGVTYGFAPQSLSLAPPDVTVDSPRELAELFA